MSKESPKKIKVHELYQAGSGQLGTTWMLKVEHPVEECLDEGFFNPAASNLMAGDSVRAARLEKDRLTEFLDIIVVERKFGPDWIDVARIGPVVSFTEVVAPQTMPGGVTFVDVAYVPEDCTAQWKGPKGKWWIVGESGVVHAKGLEDKDMAHSIARGDEPLPEKEAA